MGRSRGYWWSPDGSQLLIARVDESPVQRWYIADPANPDKAPAEVALPGCRHPQRRRLAAARHPRQDAGTAARPARGGRVGPGRLPLPGRRAWGEGAADRRADPRSEAHAARSTPPPASCCARTPTRTGPTSSTACPPSSPAGDIVWTGISGDTRGLIVAPAGRARGRQPVTPPGLQVLGVLGTDGDDVLFAGATEPTEIGVWRYGPGGLTRARPPSPACTPPRPRAARPCSTGRDLAGNAGGHGPQARRRAAGSRTGSRRSRRRPNLPHPQPKFLQAGPAGIRTAVLFPSWHQPGTRLPVLMDPYGGPHHQR